MDLDKAIKERHSARRFKSTKPDYSKILEAIDAARKVPLAGNIPSLKFMLITDKEKINELAQAATQDFIASVHYVVIVCSNVCILIPIHFPTFWTSTIYIYREEIFFSTFFTYCHINHM